MCQAGTDGREINLSFMILGAALRHAMRIGHLVVIVVDVRGVQSLRSTLSERVSVVRTSTLAEPGDDLFLVGLFIAVIVVRAILDSRDIRFTIHEDTERVLSFSLPFAVEALFLDVLGVLSFIVALRVEDELALEHQLVFLFYQQRLLWEWRLRMHQLSFVLT